MTLQALLYFKTLANYRNFTRAAASLFVSQSALSHSIQALEQELGVPLFQRRRHESWLTPYGEQLLAYTQEILLSVDNLQAQLSEQKECFSKPLRITIKMGLYSLKDMLGAFHLRYPSARLEVHQSDQSRIAYMPWDFSFLNLSTPSNDPMDTLLFEESFQLAVSKVHPLATQACLSLDKLEPYPGIWLLLDQTLQSRLEQIFHDTGFHPNYSITTDHFHFILRQLHEGRHWALLPNISMNPRDDHELVFRSVSNLDLRRYVYLRRNGEHYFGRSAQIFQEFCRGYAWSNQGAGI